MSDIGNALNQGAEFARGLAADDRKTAAYNALANTYGVALAGDPDTTIKAQEFQQREKTNPIAVQQAQSTLTGTDLENTGKQETNTYNALANPKQLVGLDLTNDKTKAATAESLANAARTNALAPGEVAQQGATLAETRAQTGNIGASAAQTRQQTAITGSDRENNAALAMVNQLLQVKNTGGDVQAAFQQMAPRITQLPGITAEHITALGPRIAEPGFLENLAGQLGNSTVAAKGMVKLPYGDGTGYALVPSGTVPKAGPGIQNYVDRKTGQVGQRTVTQAQSPQAVDIAKTDLGQMDLQYQRTDQTINKALSLVSSASTGYGAETIGRLPGSSTKALQAQIDSMKGNVALLTANMSRQGGKGTVPIPVRNMAEFKAYQEALGAVNPLADAATVHQQLQTVKTNLASVRDAIHAKYAATYGDAVLPADKSAKPRGQFQEGVTYTDAKGNKATYKGGQFVPAGGWSIKQVP
jgi:hypothetical protein